MLRQKNYARYYTYQENGNVDNDRNVLNNGISSMNSIEKRVTGKDNNWNDITVNVKTKNMETIQGQGGSKNY